MFKPKLSENYIENTNEGEIYPVYISSRVISELINFCKETYPKEALAFLVGVKARTKGEKKQAFTKVVDWVTGSVDSTHISANFTTEGLQQANLFLDDRYGKNREKKAELPKIIGIVHSHPFGQEPTFSSIDLDTFLNFPYNAEGNVFILIDPVSNPPYFKVYKIFKEESNNTILQHISWIEYSSIKSEYSKTEEIHGLQGITNEIINKEEDDPYIPPKIEDLDKNKNRKGKKNLGNFFN
jgi:proteasome lid subunit RPN8/RPN11